MQAITHESLLAEPLLVEPLLVELLTEELPPKALKKLGDAFASGIHAGITARGLATADASMEMFATPRRLAVRIAKVLPLAPDRAESKKLMPAKVAFDTNGDPTPALQKRLEKEGAALSQTVRKTEGAEELVYLDLNIKGETLKNGLQSALSEALAKLPIPKMMSYQLADGLTSVQFVRPAHGLVALHGSSVVAVNTLGLSASNITSGHRFQGEKTITLAHANDFETALEKSGGVIAAFDKRRAEIERLLNAHAEQCGDNLGNRDDYVALLDEVTGLVEMPTVYVGKFEDEFLEVPAECLILTMKLNQKYFPLFNVDGGLSSHFLIVSNMRLDDPRNVIEGNQRVVRPRLSDARFFFETDKKTKLVDRLPKLASVVYHNRLGSQGERVERVRVIAKAICQLTNKDAAFQASVDRAAQLAKADLVTDMVGEFPELQGTMGKYYALHEGMSRDVAEAIEDHYRPRFAGDALPRSDVGVVVALADKLETLVGMFGIGQTPTGDKDPFALRRHAIGVCRMLVECELPIGLTRVLGAAERAFGEALGDGDWFDPLRNFILDRARVFFLDMGYLPHQVESAMSAETALFLQREESHFFTMLKRLDAARAFDILAEASNLAAANKRISNILKKAEGAVSDYSPEVLVESAEILLAQALVEVMPIAKSLYDEGDFTASLLSFAVLSQPIDTFFEHVMVNVDDPAVRANRLGLLATLHREMNRVADLSKLAT